MAVESATTLAGLNPAWPLGTDLKSEGDDHIRLIKSLLKSTFPNEVVPPSGIDISFGYRITPDRFVWNDKADLTGTDVAIMDETGRMALGMPLPAPAGYRSGLTVKGDVTLNASSALAFNAYFDPSATWKALSNGWMGYLIIDPATGQVDLARSATSIGAGVTVTPPSLVKFVADGSATFLSTVRVNNDANFWLGVSGATKLLSFTANRYLGWDSGSDQYIFNGVGLSVVSLTSAGAISGTAFSASTGTYVSTSNQVILATGSAGTVILRPNGAGSATGQAFVAANGDFTITSATATKNTAGGWVAPSDARLKNVQGDYTHGLTELLQVQPKQYTFKTDPDGDPIVGVIAQDIEDVLPECVKLVEGEIAGKTVADIRQYDMTPLTYALINAVKTLSARLDALEAAPAARQEAGR
jgi:hypothetical protein